MCVIVGKANTNARCSHAASVPPTLATPTWAQHRRRLVAAAAAAIACLRRLKGQVQVHPFLLLLCQASWSVLPPQLLPTCLSGACGVQGCMHVCVRVRGGGGEGYLGCMAASPF